MIADGYEIRCHCDGKNHDRMWDNQNAQFTGENRREAMKAAKAAGWIIKRDRTCYCPKCREEA